MISKISKILCATMFFTLALMPVIAFALTSINSKIGGSYWIEASRKVYEDKTVEISSNEKIDDKKAEEVIETNKSTTRSNKVISSSSSSHNSYSNLAQIVENEDDAEEITTIVTSEIPKVTLPADDYQELQNIIESETIEEELQNNIPLVGTPPLDGHDDGDVIGLPEPTEKEKIKIKTSKDLPDDLLIIGPLDGE